MHKGKFQDAGLKKGHILLSFDKHIVKNNKELAKLICNTKGAALLKVLDTSKGSAMYLAVDFGDNAHYNYRSMLEK